MGRYTIVIHGGAGTILREKMSAEKEKRYRTALENALDKGYTLLEAGESAMDAVEKAVNELEDSPLFNAGKGSVFTHEGKHEMDAAMMDGATRKAGAVSLITGVKNPISLARDVLTKSGHVFLAGKGAMDFARELGYEMKEPAYFYDEYRHKQWLAIKDTKRFELDHSRLHDNKFGTVGAVACDKDGNIAAATSTGGLTNKHWGRIGDSPIIGAGTYAYNKTCAISCTGTGEYFIRGVVAYDVSCLMEYKGMSLKEAADEVIHKRVIELGGDGGLIGVDAAGNIALPFNTDGMYRGYRTSEVGEDMTKLKEVKIYKE